MHNNTIFGNNVSILLAWLSAAGKEVVLYLVARNTLLKKGLPLRTDMAGPHTPPPRKKPLFTIVKNM
jgi:hypothetical protein